MSGQRNIQSFLVKIGFFLLILLSGGSVDGASVTLDAQQLSAFDIELVEKRASLDLHLNWKDLFKPSSGQVASSSEYLDFSFLPYLRQHNRLILLRFKNAEATVLTFDRQTSAILNLQPLFPTGDSLFPFVS